VCIKFLKQRLADKEETILRAVMQAPGNADEVAAWLQFNSNNRGGAQSGNRSR
jgi:hypothetical protein